MFSAQLRLHQNCIKVGKLFEKIGGTKIVENFFLAKKWASPGLFFSLFSSFQHTVDSKQMFNI